MKQIDTIELSVARHKSPIGPLWLAADNAGKAVGISMRGDGDAYKTRLHRRFPAAVFNKRPEPLAKLKAWLELYFSGKPPAPQTLAWRLGGTDFQQQVWTELAQVPYATVLSYGELAARVGCNSARAIGQAVGRNPLSILIPCHRVVAANRGLGGFSSGIAFKIKLLNHEGLRVDPSATRILL